MDLELLPNTKAEHTIHWHVARFIKNASHLLIQTYGRNHYVSQSDLGGLLGGVPATAEDARIVKSS